MYYLRLFTSRGFKAAPVKTLARAAHLAVRVAMRSDADITVPFGSTRFRFRYVHGKRYGGGRGLFLYRDQIEDLMAYGDRFLSIGDVVIDGGANQGVFSTAFASYVGPTGRVLAVEPMRYAVDRVRQNAELNGLQGIVEVVELALSDAIETVTLDLTRGVGSASITNDYGGDETVKIETTTIDTLVSERGLSRVDFIKLDIEGAELKALKGAARTIAAHHPTICLEISTGSGGDVEQQAHFHLLELGYSAHEFRDGRLVGLAALEPPHPNVFYLYEEPPASG